RQETGRKMKGKPPSNNDSQPVISSISAVLVATTRNTLHRFYPTSKSEGLLTETARLPRIHGEVGP
ncbi:hypothetical protein, partial [Zhihengliuella halotolerans]|uniref:hypothetical protein n=1 Tax=Zhihengliuella halotolerans TaxID=370736 RepID=UPI001CA48FDF